MNKWRKILICILASLLFNFTYSQTDSTQPYTPYEIIDGDTVALLTLKEFHYKDPTYEAKWRRTVYFVTRVYPYAQIVDSLVQAHEAQIAQYEREKRSKRKIKKANKKLKKNLKEEYSMEIKNMSVTRGNYLAKLVHRNTGMTIHELIKKYKNGANAFMWNSVMKLYGGADLKATYNPKGEDWMIELVIKEIKKGLLYPVPRQVQKERLLKSLQKK